jgi:hypothetical protein
LPQTHSSSLTRTENGTNRSFTLINYTFGPVFLTCCQIALPKLVDEFVDSFLRPDNIVERGSLVTILRNNLDAAVVRKVRQPETVVIAKRLFFSLSVREADSNYISEIYELSVLPLCCRDDHLPLLH